MAETQRTTENGPNAGLSQGGVDDIVTASEHDGTPREPPEPGPPRQAVIPAGAMVTRLLILSGTAVMAGIIAVHLGLLNHAAWGGDEYTTVWNYRIHGPVYLWFRLWSWSPRPVSEVLLALYAAAVLLWRQPLIVPLFAIGWIVYLASSAPMLRHRTRDGMASQLLGTAAILAFILLGPHVNFVFYWPIGIVAYMPVIAAALFLLFSLANEYAKPDPHGPFIVLVLIATAWTSEWGASLVLVYSGLAMLHELVLRRMEIRIVLRWSIPLLAAASVVLAAMINSRTGDPMFAAGDASFYHHLFPSLLAAASLLPREFLSIDGETFDGRHFLLGAIVRILFFAGVHFCWATRDRMARPGFRYLPVLALSAVVAAFLTMAGSFRQFGEVCCGQEAEMRYAMGFIALTALAIWLPPILPGSIRWSRGLAPVLLVAAAIPLLLPRYKDLAWDYIFYFEPGRARDRTWASGFSPGPTMTLYQPVSDNVFPAQIPPGFQVAGDNWWTLGILGYFDKQSVTVLLAARHEPANR